LHSICKEIRKCNKQVSEDADTFSAGFGIVNGACHNASVSKPRSEVEDMHRESDSRHRHDIAAGRLSKRALVIVILANLVAAPAWPQPHSVAGVDADDVLNIRSDIDDTRDVGSSEIVGHIPHDATDVRVTGVSVDLEGARWREIEYHGTIGWVNERYLRPTSLLLQPPQALHCAGTEPFWDITIDGTDSTFNSPDLDAPIRLDYLRFEPGIGRTDLWGHYLSSVDGVYSPTVIVRYTEACSDGMSDLTYDYEAFLLGLGASGAPAYGCCSIKR